MERGNLVIHICVISFIVIFIFGLVFFVVNQLAIQDCIADKYNIDEDDIVEWDLNDFRIGKYVRVLNHETKQVDRIKINEYDIEMCIVK